MYVTIQRLSELLPMYRQEHLSLRQNIAFNTFRCGVNGISGHVPRRGGHAIPSPLDVHVGGSVSIEGQGIETFLCQNLLSEMMDQIILVVAIGLIIDGFHQAVLAV